MPYREMLEVGNNFVDADDEFAEGYVNGGLYYYDTNNPLPDPLNSEIIHTFTMDALHNQRQTSLWNTGFIFGWIAALCENDPEYIFTSIVLP